MLEKKVIQNILAKKDSISEIRYKSYKNRLTNILQHEETQYYSEKLNSVKGHIKSSWRILKNVINKDVNSFTYRGSKITNDDQITNIFNDYFVNVGPSLAKSIGIINKDPADYLNGNYPKTMFLCCTYENEIFNAIMKEKSNKASGYDDTSIYVVKYTADILCKPLSFMFNTSLEMGIFPDSLKVAKVIPIYRSGDRDIFSNYKPISVLCTFSKLLEKIFYNRLVNYVNAKNILTESQNGFREKRSTKFALIDLIEEVRISLD